MGSSFSKATVIDLSGAEVATLIKFKKIAGVSKVKDASITSPKTGTQRKVYRDRDRLWNHVRSPWPQSVS